MIGPLADVLIFFAAIGAGVRPGPAQLASFSAATALNYFLMVRPKAAAAGSRFDVRLHVQLLVVALLAYFLRNGVLALLQGWGWPVRVAIVFGALATAAVTRPGNAFFLSSPTWKLHGDTQWRAMAMCLVTYAFVLRLVFAGQTQLLPEEAYYWNYSRHLDIGYLDHPPMVAWLIRLGTAAFGDSEFGVRIGALCCGAIASFFTYRLTRNLFGEPSALLALVLAQILPFFFLTGMLMTPDAPLSAAWAASLYFLERALIADRSGAWWRAGVCLGLGLLSKYTIGLLAPATLIFMLVDPKARRWFRRPQPYAAALLALAIFTPVIVWNAQHGWASFAFQTSRRIAETPKFAFHRLVGSALVLLTPTGLLAVAVGLFDGGSNAAPIDSASDNRRQWRFIRVSVLVPLAVFAAYSLRHEVKLDWSGALWLAALPAMALGIVARGERFSSGMRTWIHAAWAPTLLAMLLIYASGLYYLMAGLPGIGHSTHVELIPVGWREFGRQINGIVEEIRKQDGTEPLVVGMDRYAIASELAFYAPEPAMAVRQTSSGHLFGGIGLMYEQWFPPGSQAGRTLLLVAWDPQQLSGDLIESHVERLGPVEEGELMRDGAVIRRYYYRIAYNYRASL